MRYYAISNWRIVFSLESYKSEIGQCNINIFVVFGHRSMSKLTDVCARGWQSNVRLANDIDPGKRDCCKSRICNFRPEPKNFLNFRKKNHNFILI